MLIRLWRTQVVPERMTDYERFERESSLPMVRQQPGCLGVLFLRSADQCAALSLWVDADAVAALADSPTYRQTVRALAATGLLVGEQRVEVFAVAGGEVCWHELARLLPGTASAA